MKHEFTLLAQGFFLYPYTSGSRATCPSIAVPVCEGHCFMIGIAANRNDLKKPKHWQVETVPSGRVELSIQGKDVRGKKLKLAGAAVRAGGFSARGEPQDGLENFNLLPDARHQTPGAALRADWEDDLRGHLDLHGGSITAVPDNTTFSKIWKIAPGIQRILSNLVRYTSELASGSLTVNGKSFAVTSESVVVMFHVVPQPVQGKAYGRGIDHNASVLKLCQERNALRVVMLRTFKSRKGKKSDQLADFAKLVQPARKAVGLSSVAPTLDPGTPSCSGRKIVMPR